MRAAAADMDASTRGAAAFAFVPVEEDGAIAAGEQKWTARGG